MKILANIITSRLWILGSSNVVFEDSLWEFYYCVEGVQTKTYNVLFYDPKKNRVFFKSPILDIKLKHVIIQKYSVVSNVYKLLIEMTTTEKGLVLWEADNNPRNKNNYCGIVSSVKRETYFCAPAIILKDTFTPLKIRNMQHSTFICDDENFIKDKKQVNNTIVSMAGYIVYRSNSGNHDNHFNKTWVSQVTVDATTFDCSFEIIYTSKRKREECLECALKNERVVYSPAVSNLLVNH